MRVLQGFWRLRWRQRAESKAPATLPYHTIPHHTIYHTTILNWLPSNARPPRWKRDTRATWIACTCATPAKVPTDLRYRRLAGTPRFQTTRKAPRQQIWQLSWQQEVKLAATTLAGRSKAARGEQTRQQWCGGSAGTVEPRESSHVRAQPFSLSITGLG